MEFTYIERLLKYYNDAIADILPNRKTCLFEKLACQRHLDDLNKQENEDYPYIFYLQLLH